MTGNNNIDWESLFERATEDISHYLWATEQWEEETYEAHDLLLEIVFRRGRGKEVLEISKKCPEEYAKYSRTLHHMFEEAESKFKSLIQKEILEDVTKRLSFLENLLEEVRHNYEEEIIFEDPDLRIEMEDSGGRFLESFLRHHYLYKQCNDFSLSDERKNKYCRKFRNIEDKFRKLFYLFYPLKDLLSRYKEEAYLPKNYWWLDETPPEEAPNEEFVNQLISLGVSKLQKQRVTQCPSTEELATYAFNEMSLSNRERIESHLLSCINCLKEVIELSHIDATVKIPSYEELEKKKIEIKVPDKILNALLPKPRVIHLDRWLEKKRKEIAEFLKQTISGFYPGGAQLEVLYMGEEEVYQIPQKVFFVIRKEEGKITLIEEPANAEPELRLLTKALEARGFSYCIFGLGDDNKLKEISKVQSKEEYDLPLEIDFKDLKGTDILWVIIHVEEESIQKLYRSITENLGKKSVSLPADIDPFAWLIVYIERRG